MAAQWPLVVAKLLEVLPTLPGWNAGMVFDGAAIDSVPDYFCTVAHSEDGQTTSVGSFTSEQAPDGAQHVEVGAVSCQLWGSNSSAQTTGDRARLFALFDAVDAWVRSDRTLGGVLSQEGTSSVSADVIPMQALPASMLTLAFTVNYATVT